MKIHDLFERRSGGYLDVTLELSSKDESVEVTVECEFDVEPTEYEGHYVFSQGGVDFVDSTMKPFTFLGKQHKEITPDLIKYLETTSAVDKKFKSILDKVHDEETPYVPSKKEADDIVNMMIDDAFQYETDKIDVPTKHYPMTR